MGKRLILILALALVVGLTCSAYAEVQNVKVSGDIKVSGIARNNMQFRDNAAAQPVAGTETNPASQDFGSQVSALLSQVRVRVDADLTDNVSTTVRLINERIWGEENDIEANAVTKDTAIDLDLAYVTLKEFLYSPLTLTVGRQEIKFGNGFIIADVDTNSIAAGHGTNANKVLPNSIDDLSLRKSFDAIRANLNYDPLIVDLVYAKIDENEIASRDDVDLYGINAGYTIDKNWSTEMYIWQRDRRALPMGTLVGTVPLGNDETENLRTVGGKVTFGGIENVSLGFESAFQWGDHMKNTILYPDEQVYDDARRKVRAFAMQFNAQMVMPTKKYTPSLAFWYTYLSGDNYLGTGTYKGWDPMFKDQGGGTLYNKILSSSNCQAFTLIGGLKPMEDVAANLSYTYLRAIHPYDLMANGVTLSGVAGDPVFHMTSAKSLGHEIDGLVTYDYTEDVQFGLNAGIFFPGEAFASDSRRKAASQVIGSMKVTF